MHESSLIPDLLEKISELARQNAASRVTSITLSIGALAGIGEEHLREHFLAAAPGTIAEGAELHIKVSEDPQAAHAGSLVLESLDLERE